MSLIRYSVLVLGIAVATFALAWAVALRRADVATRCAAAFGAGLALANTVAAHALVLWSYRRPPNAFLGPVLGGMVGRMAAMLAAMVAGVFLLGLPKVPLAVSLLSYFVLFLTMELSVLYRRMSAVAAPPGAGEAER